MCVPTHVALRMFIMQVLASQLHFLANKNAELAIPPLFWPVNCIKIGGHVALLSDPTVYSLYCAKYLRTLVENISFLMKGPCPETYLVFYIYLCLNKN